MGHSSALAMAIMVAAGLGGPASAATCPISDSAAAAAGGFASAVHDALKAAPTCEKAYKLLSTCALGSSGDNALAGIVQAKCEPLFMARASRLGKRAYINALRRCDRIALNNEGTMYQGMAAVCRAGASRDYARHYSARR